MRISEIKVTVVNVPFVAPIRWSGGANTEWTRLIIEMRTDAGAEEELRLVFDMIARRMLEEAPGLFQDFRRSEDGSWVPEHRKV